MSKLAKKMTPKTNHAIPAGSLIPAIQWHEGMLLSPQHFQQNDVRFEQMLNTRFRLSMPNYYGVYSLQIDPVVIPDGIFRIVSIQAVMPDGLIVDYQLSSLDNAPLEIDLTKSDDAASFAPGQEISINLIISEYVRGVSPVIGKNARYLSNESAETKDFNLDDNVIKMPHLVPNITLHAGGNLPGRKTGMPIARMTMQDKVFTRVNYTPPTFLIAHDTDLWKRCSEVCQKIREKASYLCERWQNQIGTPMLKETGALLQPLMMCLPKLEIVLNAEVIQPWTLYEKLCEVCGILTALRLSQMPPVLPADDHEDILG